MEDGVSPILLVLGLAQLQDKKPAAASNPKMETPSLRQSLGIILLMVTLLGILLSWPGPCQICDGSGIGRLGCFGTTIPPCPACGRTGTLPAAKRFWIEARFWKYEYQHRHEEQFEVFTY